VAKQTSTRKAADPGPRDPGPRDPGTDDPSPPDRGRRDAGRPRGASVVDAVFAATLDELAAVGMERLSIDRIARRASLNKTSVYRRWPTREALVAAALERMADTVAAGTPDTGSLRGDLLGLLAPVTAMMSEPAGRALLRAAIAEESAVDVAALAARALTQQSAAPIRDMISRAVSRGEWRSGAPPDVLLSMLIGAAMHRAMMEHAPLSGEWLEAVVDMALFGAMPRRDS
jgi:AcrR family transcriptional regulator